MQERNLIEVRDLKVQRGSFKLEIPSWSVSGGSVIGLVGPNGAGKTTLLEVLAGMRPAVSGSVRVFERNPWSDPVYVRSRLGFMSDDMPLFDMRIGELLRMLSGYYPTWDRVLVDKLLDRFKLNPKDKVRNLSKGEGTRIRLVAAMAFQPQVLLLDEPASGLDLAGRRSLLESVLEVVRDAKRSVVISSHMLQDIERIADRLLVIRSGTVVAEGATDAIVGDDRTLEEAMIGWEAAG